MKILLLTHGFPPAQAAGAELYAAQTAAGLSARGHAVVVLAPTTAGDADDYEVRSEARSDGLRVLRLTNRYADLFDLSWTYANPRVDAALVDVLRRERPDVVHVHHTIGTSAGIFAAARRLGVPTVVTLHDYWFLCARGQRLMPDGHVCAEIEPARCAACIRGKRLAYATNDARGWLRGQHPHAPRSVLARAATWFPHLARHAAAQLGSAPIERRTRALLDALGSAGAVLAPSRFLLEEYVRAGLPPERVRHWPYGVDAAAFRGAHERAPVARPRFAFVGSLQPSKGVDLLLRAFAGLPQGAAQLTVHGAVPAAAGAAFARQVEQLAAARSDVVLAGPFAHDRIAAVLAATDVLVVPSRWYENWPLALLESVLAKVASIAADHGSMREFAQTFGTCVTFRPGDAADLTRALRSFVDDPGLAARLAATPRQAVRSIDDDVAALVQLYEDLLAGADGVGR